jgi:hypothetical protein
MKKVATTVCYLCGKPLAPPINVDHPVMQQIFAPDLRRKYNVSKLITFDVHEACNTAYRSDEDYFVRTLVPFARGSEAGNAIYKKVLDDFRSGKQVPLAKMVLEEFDPKPSGLVLPSGKVVKKLLRTEATKTILCAPSCLLPVDRRRAMPSTKRCSTISDLASKSRWQKWFWKNSTPSRVGWSFRVAKL